MSLPYNFLFQLPTDNVASEATITVQSGSEDPDYLAANIADGNPAKPAKLTSTDGAWMFQFPAPQRLDLASIIHHNFDLNLDVRLQGHASNAWGAPTLDLPFTIDADVIREDGFHENPYIDIAEAIPLAANRTFEFWRIVIDNANSAPVAIGDVWLGENSRELTWGIQWGSDRGEERPIIEHLTDMLVSLRYDLGVVRRTLRANIEPDQEDLDAVKTLRRVARGKARAFLIVPDSSENSAWLVTFGESKTSYKRITRGRFAQELTFTELSRGLPL